MSSIDASLALALAKPSIIFLLRTYSTMSQSWSIFASTPLSNTHRQILPAVGQRTAIWTRATVDQDNDLFIPDAPPWIDTPLRRAASTLSPMVDLAANGLRGIKRAADLVSEYCPCHFCTPRALERSNNQQSSAPSTKLRRPATKPQTRLQRSIPPAALSFE